MSTIPLEKVEEATKLLTNYHLKLELSPGDIVYEGEVDELSQSLYFQIGFARDKLHFANFLRLGNVGYGKRSNFEQWRRVRVVERFPKYSRSALEILKKEQIISTTEEKRKFWKAEVRLSSILPLENPEQFFRSIFERLGWTDEKFLYRIIKLSQDISVISQIWISQEDYQIKKITVTFMGLSSKEYGGMTATFSRSKANIPILHAEELAVTAREIPMSALFFTLPSIGGWRESNHCAWAQRSIDLIKAIDQEGKYVEIYHEDWQPFHFYERPLGIGGMDRPLPGIYHPIVTGAYYEDQRLLEDFYKSWLGYDPKPDKFERDYNHYGGEDLGLAWDDIFGWRDHTPPPPKLDRYYSARDWGYGSNRLIDPNHNLLTFTEAIKQYNKDSIEGKRNAYLILGHAIHLLQDVGMPDHAILVSHPGSGKTEPEAYKEFYICEGYATDAAAIAASFCPLLDFVCYGIVFASVYGLCIENIDPAQVGYERLISDKWRLNRIESKIQTQSIQREQDYDTYFEDLANLSIAEATKRGLSSPLGCGPAWIFAIKYIKGLDPDIDSTDENDTRPYLELTDTLVENIVTYGAGLIQHFYEIVNHPPYVQRVVIVKAPSGLSPDKFAHFKECPAAPIMYDARWVNIGVDTNISRCKRVDEKRILSSSHNAYIFIVFGPTIGPLKSKTVRKDTLKLKLVALSPTGNSIEKEVSLDIGFDQEIGHYYWSSFKPDELDSNENYSLTMKIDAYDMSAHLSTRELPGDRLDSNPGTVAMVNADDPHYEFVVNTYEPDVDTNHRIEIAPPIKPDEFEPNNTFSSASLLNMEKTGKPIEIVATLEQEDKIDYFRISWDNIDIGDFSGSFFTTIIAISASEKFGGDLDLKIYRSDQSLIESIGKKSFAIYPTGLFGDNSLYLTVENPSTYCQGSICYNLAVSYGLKVNPLSPLYNKWWWLHLPPDERRIRVGDDIIRYLDYVLFVQDLERLIPVIIEDIGTISQKERGNKIAGLQYSIGKTAQSIGLYRYAERLYLQSIKAFDSNRNHAREIDVLRGLRDLYSIQGMTEETEKITKRLKVIG